MKIKAENLQSEASDKPPQITGDAVMICVVVACPGIEPHRLPRIIDSDDIRCSENNLEICSAAAIIKQHGGLIRVEPQAAGITYVIYLPAFRGR